MTLFPKLFVSLICVMLFGFSLMLLFQMPSNIKEWTKWGVMDAISWVGIVISSILLLAATIGAVMLFTSIWIVK